MCEVGSWKGRSSRAIADNLPPDGILFCVDTFNGSSGEPDAHKTAKDRAGDDTYLCFCANLADHIEAGRVVPLRMDSANAAGFLKDMGLRLDACFLDGDHSHEGIKRDIEAWKPLVKEGGLLCGHDYYLPEQNPLAWVGVRQCVDELFPEATQAPNTTIWQTRITAPLRLLDLNMGRDLIEPRGGVMGTISVDAENKSATVNLVSQKSLTVTAEISTKDRYTTTLPMCIAAILNQTRLPERLVIYDDGEQKDLRELSPFSGLLKLADDKGISWEIFTTPREGQVKNHQHALDNCTTDLIWRIDDDEVAEPNCLENLLAEMKDGVGAVAGLVHHPGSGSPLPAHVDGSLNDVSLGLNLQWFDLNGGGAREVSHLYSTFLFSVDAARKAGGYPMNLSVCGHREETIFSARIHRAGYKLIVTPKSKTAHLRESSGGIRSYSDPSLWEHDEQVFQEYLKAWGVVQPDTKMFVLDCGIGDHWAFRSVLPKLREMYQGKKIVLAVCYPSTFDGEDVTLISIADAKRILGSEYENSSIYKWAWEHDRNGPLAESMLAMHII
jgi:GT2 family glycosyltransferase